jgi:hypothetical protein
MRKIARFLLIMVTTLRLVACVSSGSAPADYYENDFHHGYPGPGTTSPE